MAKYLKYKKLEAGLNPILDNQSVEYYLKNYARFSLAHQIRFTFREKAIAYSARDIGHQIRLDWLWHQASLCVQHLERLFKPAEAKSVEAKPVDKPKPSVTQKERVEYRKVFRTYSSTKKKVEDYEGLIEKALESDERVVQRQLQEFHDDLHKLLGPYSRDIRWTIDLGKLVTIYFDMVDPKIDYATQPQMVVTPFNTPYDNTQKLNYTTIGYGFMVGSYLEKIPSMTVSPVLHHEFLTPEENLEVQTYVDNFNFMTDIVEKIVDNEIVVYFSSKLLRLFYNFSFVYLIIGGTIFSVEYGHRMKQLRPFKRNIPGMIFTREQLNLLDVPSFIQSEGNVKQLLAWRNENLQNNPNEAVSTPGADVPELLPEYLEAVIVTEYYTQALAQDIARAWSLPSDDFFLMLDRIGHALNMLTKHFTFSDVVGLVQRYRGSGIFRRNIADTGLMHML